jgi:myo-inositol-1(or 4)-monophosphatase
MQIEQNDLTTLKNDIYEIVKHLYKMKEPSVTQSSMVKKDNTLVTDIDLAISNLFEQFCEKRKTILISEENKNRNGRYPVAILDPIDGTRELALGLPECCVSFSLYYGSIKDKRNFSWIFNPFTGFELLSTQPFLGSKMRREKRLLGLISNSESEQGLYENIILDSMIQLSTRGSIAFKLSLLASGACDFVVSKKGKNIWDILAGTHLCDQRGIQLYSNGEVLSLENEIEITSDLLLWCPPEHAHSLNQLFLNETKTKALKL